MATHMKFSLMKIDARCLMAQMLGGCHVFCLDKTRGNDRECDRDRAGIHGEGGGHTGSGAAVCGTQRGASINASCLSMRTRLRDAST